MGLHALVEESKRKNKSKNKNKNKSKNKSNVKSSGQECPLHTGIGPHGHCLLQGFDYGVVEFGAELFDGFVGAVGPGAVG